MQHVWIFQLKDSLSSAQQEALAPALTKLVDDWKSHGAMVPGEYGIKYDRFIVVQAEPGSTSGCSIDSMNHGVDAILEQNGLEALPHNNIFFRTAEGGLDYVDFREVRTAIAAGRLGPDTQIFDSSLGQTNDFSRWEIKLADSWMSRFLPASKEA